MSNYQRGYVNGRFGQIHYHRAWPDAEGNGKTPLAFFHQNHKSAFEYDMLLREMGRDRESLAFDTPGYGSSDGPPYVPTMADFAGSMADALDGLGFGANGKGAVDVFGLHTGVLIATELALTRPDLVRRIVMSGVPYRSPERRREILESLPRDRKLTEDGAWIKDRWKVLVADRSKDVPLERAARVFAEAIRPLTSTGMPTTPSGIIRWKSVCRSSLTLSRSCRRMNLCSTKPVWRMPSCCHGRITSRFPKSR